MGPPLRQLAGAAAVPLGRPAEAAVFLGVDSHNSLDSAVNAVLRSLPGIDVRTALAMALHAGRSGGYALALGPRADVGRCYERLRELGIKNTWCGPPAI